MQPIDVAGRPSCSSRIVEATAVEARYRVRLVGAISMTRIGVSQCATSDRCRRDPSAIAYALMTTATPRELPPFARARRAYAPDAAAPAEWGFRWSSKTGVARTSAEATAFAFAARA